MPQSGFDRDLLAETRDRMSAEWDTGDDARDLEAVTRDDRAEERDRAAARRDRELRDRILDGTRSSPAGAAARAEQEQIDRERELSEVDLLRGDVLELLALVREDRRAAADDRHSSREDRLSSGASRHHAAEDRQASAADRDAAAAERAQREIERNLASVPEVPER